MRIVSPRVQYFLPLVLAALSAGPGQAQTAPAPAVFGPAMPGVCLFSQTQVVARSKLGMSANQQLEALAKSAESELGGQRTAILNDGRALAADKAKLTAAQYDQRQQQLQQRAKTFDQLASTRNAQLQRTRIEVSTEVGRALGPIVNGLITARHCSVVLDKGATYGANPAMDLTDSATQQLDQRVPSLRVTLSPPAAAPAAR